MSGGHPEGHCEAALSRLDMAFQQALLRALVAGTDAYVSCIDRSRRILFLNRTRSRDLEQILRSRIDDFIAPQHKEEVFQCVEQAFVSRQPRSVEFAALLATGEPNHLLTRVIPFSSPTGEDVAVLITSDVSEPRRLAAELEESVEFRRRVVENLPDFVALVDRDLRLVWVNRVGPGLRMEDVIGARADAFMEPEHVGAVHSAMQAAFESGSIGQYEIEGYRDGKTTAWYATRVVPVQSEGRVEHVILITADITERRRAAQALRETEEQLQRAQRLESLGQLAGGIAHDFNNLLQVIEGNLSFAKQGLEHGQRPTDELDQAIRATERAAELTSHLLAIGRRQHVDSKRVDLGQLVERSMRMLRRAIPENIRFQYEVPAAHYFVALDAPQFEQVLINLCVNARDAMPEGGTLTVRIDQDGPAHVQISVSDTGVGIAPEHLSRVFEPFFTTKGAGSGLGLAVAAGIIAAHGGVITAESDGVRGATMKVRLPCAPPSSGQSLHEDSSLSSGVILIAEDEELVRMQVERILRRAGYTVLQANNGKVAVELFRERKDEIDLVILDVVMPELDGWRAYLMMEQLVPEVKVLFTTGYAANVLPQDFAARGARLISKPYKPQRLLEQVRELLNQTG
ncbi:MAG TPA: ATP-binding protein [Polyangiaceae bacterium]|nr:ATP-binding protein [Polyangiaceae bacterium]